MNLHVPRPRGFEWILLGIVIIGSQCQATGQASFQPTHGRTYRLVCRVGGKALAVDASASAKGLTQTLCEKSY